MKRRLPILIGLAAIAIALVVWKWRDVESTTESTSRETTGKIAARATSQRVDPRTLPRGLISGNVSDEARQPIAGATVCADIEDEELPTSLRRESTCTSSDAHGAFALRELLASTYVVVAGAKSYRPGSASLSLASGESKLGVDLTLSTGGVEITGTVSDIGGGPVAHAKVRVREYAPDGARSPHVDTDDRGHFSLWIRPGAVQVQASADGYVTARAGCTAPCRLDLLLTPESSIAGVVVDAATGTPVEGARVEVESSEWTQDGVRVSERTDATGSFHARGLVAARYDVVATTERAYGSSEGSILVGLGHAVDRTVIKVFPAAAVSARIVATGDAPHGCPKGGVVLRLLSSNTDVKARTDVAGNIVANGILRGTYHVEPWCDGHATRLNYSPLVVTDADVTGVVWEVDAGSTVRGRVTSIRGEPIAGAGIEGRTWGPRNAYHRVDARSGPDGRYELRGLRAGKYFLHARGASGSDSVTRAEVEALESGVLEKDFVLEDRGAITGTVVDTEGSPVAGIRVEASLPDDSWPMSHSPDSDALGAFTITGLRPGEYRLGARRNFAHVATEKTQVMVRTGPTVVKLVAKIPAGAIKGTVVDDDGKPLADTYVTAAPEGLDGHGPELTRNEYVAVQPVMTGSDGAYALKGLTPGAYMLRAYRRGGGEAILRNVAVGSTITLTIKRTASIEGVAKAGGIAPLQITLLAEDRATGFSRAETMTRTDGKFALRDLPAGHYLVSIESETGRASTELDLAPGEARVGVMLELERMVSITGRIVDLVTREPVDALHVRALRASDGPRAHIEYRDPSRTTDASGRFTVTRVSPGRVTIDAGTGNGEYLSVTRTIEGAGTVDVGDLALARSRLTPDGQPGELGITVSAREIRSVAAGSSAATAGLVVGDVIRSIDGIDVTGEHAPHVRTLLEGPVGMKVLLGLARGVTVPVILGPRTSP